MENDSSTRAVGGDDTLCIFLSSIYGVQSGYFGSHVDTTINRQPFMIKSIDAMYASYLTQYFLTSFLYFTTNMKYPNTTQQCYHISVLGDLNHSSPLVSNRRWEKLSNLNHSKIMVLGNHLFLRVVHKVMGSLYFG